MHRLLNLHVDIVNLIIAAIPIFTIYVSVEGMRHLGFLKGEYARKAIHIGVGVALALLPAFMNRREIAVFLGLFFLGVVILVGYLHKFSAYEDVHRWTIGQFLYPLSLLLVVFIFSDPLVYSFAVLELAFADGLAAVAGNLFGRRRYNIPGGYKTWVGSLTFYVITITLMAIFARIGTDVMPYTLAVIVFGSLLITFTEGLIAGGFDNLAVPLLAALVMHSII